MRKVNLNILAACVLIMTLAGPVGADTHYVSPGQSIQAAIDDANDGDEIEVALGTYNEAINFKGKAIRLYSSGGPAVTTIDATGLSFSSVVSCTSGERLNTILTGFTITGGTGTPDDSGRLYGGGMLNVSSRPTVTNCTFRDNTASEDGGGMYNDDFSSPTVINCTFIGNSAREGGGMHNNDYSSPRVTNCTFSDNTASEDGGGMYNWDHSSPRVTNCTFSENEADRGGGMRNHYSSPTVTKCIFWGNTASRYGGGMLNTTGSNPTVTNCTFSNNEAGRGGGMYNWTSSPTVTNCIFSDNTATWLYEGGGGGMYNYDYSSPMVTNCTFSGNVAGGDGAGLCNYYYGKPKVTNCILWGDTPSEIYSSPSITYSDVQGGWPGEGNINADPCFVDANNPDPNLWNLRLKPDSPCIDAGDTTMVFLVLDPDGYPRAIDDPHTPNTGRSVFASLNVVDMGAYEFQPCRIAGDSNCDGVVDFKDVAILCSNWLAGIETEL